jgi:threonine/homoserine/homoserine lactone efflux protein
MLDFQQLSIFVATSFLLAVTPGPDILYVLTRGMTQGRKAALSAAAGFSLGNIAHTAFAVAGLSAVLMSSAAAFAAIKYAGAAYLIYIGWKTLRSGAAHLENGNGKILSPKAIFIQSITANILNPKVALFFLAFFPQFIKPQNGSTALQMIMLGSVFITCTFIVFSLSGLLAGSMGDWLKKNEKAGALLNKAAGVILIALGLSLALHKR